MNYKLKRVLAVLLVVITVLGWYVTLFGIGDAVKPTKDNIKLGLDIKGGLQLKAVVVEVEVVDQCVTDVAHTDQNTGEVTIHAQNTGNLLAKSDYIIAVALLTVSAEAIEVLTNLRCSESHFLCKFL